MHNLGKDFGCSYLMKIILDCLKIVAQSEASGGKSGQSPLPNGRGLSREAEG